MWLSVSLLLLLLSSPSLAADRRVTIPTADLVLEGTLALPDAAGPVPGIVLVHGSGPQTRNENMPGQLNMMFGFNVPVFAELSAALVESGYAVLRYDKRTCGPFNGCASNGYPTPPLDISIDMFADDAEAALTWLGQQPEVDASKLVVLGHSQGGTFVPELTTRVDGVVAGVAVGTNLRPVDQLVEQQLLDSEALMKSMGAQPAAIAQATAPLAKAVGQLRALRAGRPTQPQIMGAPTSFWESWLAQADKVEAQAKAATRPILVLGGSLDTNVTPPELTHWTRALPEGRGHLVKELPCISHALTCIDSPEVAKTTPEHLGHTVHPTVTAEIVSFLGGALK